MGWKFTLSFFAVCLLFSWQLNGQDCGTSFVDSGGANGNYFNNESQSWTFCPDEAGDLVTLNFSVVEVESCCDVLAIYNGADTSTPLEFDLESPEAFTSSSADGCLTVTWSSDGSVVFAGWAANITCAPPPPCPNPENLSLVNATSSGAIIEWDQVGNVSLWDIEVVPSGMAPAGTPTITDIAASPYTWEGGDSGTSYDLYLRGHCDEEGLFTNWVGPLVFTTNPACGDSFYDTGGPNGTYQNNEFETWTFCPDNPGDLVTLNFISVSVETCCDEIAIYDGSDTSTPLETDLENPASFSSTTEDGCLTVTFDSDGSVIFDGWEAIISCAPAPPCPNPTMLSVLNTTTTGAVIEWNQVGDVTVWDMEIIPAGALPTGIPNATEIMASPYTWDQGESATEYDAYIRGRCETEGEFTNWVGPITFRTAPACGDLFYDTGGPDNPYQVNEDLEWVICPEEAGDQVTLAFLSVEIDPFWGQLGIYNGTGSGTAWSADLESPDIFTSNAEDGCLTVTWTSGPFNPLAGWTALVSCNPAPACPNPVELFVTDITSSGATLNWTEFGDSESWNIEVVPIGTIPTGIPTVANVTSTSYVWDEGESGTEYQFLVQSNCLEGGETSNWTGPVLFATIPGCGDSFFDSGGPNGAYDNGEAESWVFCPDNAGDVVVLDFTFVDTEANFDFLAVYDGSDTSTPFDLELQAPATFVSTTDDGCLSVTFSSDGSVTREGWEAFILCTPCPPVFPQDVSTVNIAAITADALVTTNATEGSLSVEVGLPGFMPGTGTTFNQPAPLLTMSGLIENTTYEYYLIYSCDDGGEGPVLGPYTFTTLFENDLGITGLASPSNDCGIDGFETISIDITNFGGNPQTLFPINYSVNGAPSGISQPQDGFYTGIVSRDSTEEFTFDLEYDFSEPGEYVIEVWTEMMDDSDTSNDTFSITIYNFVPPLYEDFEAGIVPVYFEASPNSFVAPMGDHNAPSSVLSAAFDFESTDPLWLDFPGIGPILGSDTLYFDYRYVNFFDPSSGAILAPNDSLKVMVSTDCGMTYDTISAITGITHVPTAEMTQVAVSLEDYEGLNIKIRMEGTFGIGFNRYFLDIDNINLYRCIGLDLEADVVGAMPGMDDGQVTLTPVGGVGPYEYLWEDGNTEATRNNLALGNYSVSVTDRFGCTGEAIVTVDVFVSSEELPEIVSNIVLAPNPTSSQSIVRANFTSTVDAQVEVVNVLGQTVWRSSVLERINQLEQQIDLSGQANGIYMVRIHADNQIVSRRLLKAD